MWLNLDNVGILELLVWDDLPGDGVPDIDDAVVVLVRAIVKENVQSVVVGLVDEHQLSELALALV